LYLLAKESQGFPIKRTRKLSRRKVIALGGVSALVAPGMAGLIRGTPGIERDASRQPSLWTNTAPAIPTYPFLDSSTSADVAVIGGGYTGLACAYYLKKLRPDLSVYVIEAHRLGSGASSRNSGAVSAGSPGISDRGFNDRGLTRLRDFIDAENIACDFRAVRTLVTLNSATEVSEARTQLKAEERLLGRPELSEGIGTDHYWGAIEKQSYSSIQPAKLMHGLAAAAVNAGVHIHENTPALAIENGKRPRIHTPQGTIESSHVVVATNAYTPRLDVMRNLVFPIHHFTVATRQLTNAELAKFGLDRWQMRFDNRLIACTFGLTPDSHFFMRLPLNYAKSNTEVWPDLPGASAIAERVCRVHYPALADLSFEHGWHGVTGHSIQLKPVVKTIGAGNVHVTVALNGLGIMAGHNFGYLTACKITGTQDQDVALLEASSATTPFPTEFYRNLILRPAISAINRNY